MPTVLTIGTFDTPHVGHAALINRCRELGKHVVVGVNSDEFVTKYKGVPPIYSQQERMDLMAELGVEVALNDGPGFWLIGQVKPDFLVIGNDWLGRDYLKQISMTAKDFQDWGLTMVYVPATMGISTSDIKARMAGNGSVGS
jgi:glycerol-3-phosphate cytidylyltransferase